MTDVLEAATGMEPASVAAIAPAAERRVVLVVEDDPFAARLIVKALDGEPAQVEIAGNAREAIAILSRGQPALILMDLNLPGTDGVTLTTLLKANPTLRHIPVVMLTGDARRETIERSISAGAAGFIVKPFSRDALLAKIERFLH